MSLNDEAIENLNAESDYLTNEEAKAVIPSAISVDASDVGGGIEVKDPDTVIELIDHEDIKIKTVTDNIEAYHTYGEVANTILAKESINQTDSQYVEQHMPGLYENVAMRQGFTEASTRVNLDKTKAYVSERVESQRQSALQIYNTYIQKQSASISLQKNTLLTKSIDAMLDELERLRRQAIEELSITSISKNLVSVKVSDDEVDGVKQVTSTDLRTCCFSAIVHGADGRINQKIAVDINNVAYSPDIRLICALTEQSSDHTSDLNGETEFSAEIANVMRKFYNSATTSKEAKLTSYQDLLMFYSTANAIRLLEQLGKVVAKIPAEFAQLDSLDEAIAQAKLVHSCSVVVGATNIILNTLEKLNTSAEVFMNAMREIA